jgi:hypothetical protein
MVVIASFEDFCARFREFLAGNGYSGELAWITSEDALFVGPRSLYVKVPDPDRSQEEARTRFEEAMREHTGVSFKVVCEIAQRTLCTVWVPSDDSERQHAMCSKTELKISAPAENSSLKGREVRSRLFWWYLQMRYRGHQDGKEFLFWG